MPTFPAFTLTALGLDMQAQAETGLTLTFTRIALGAGAAADPATATDLVDQRMTADIQQFTNMGSGSVRLRAVFSNAALATGFGMSEVGIFALDPTTAVEKLHSYAKTATPDYMPPSSGPALVEQIFDAIIAIGSATSVTAVIDDLVMIATKDDLHPAIAARTIYTTGTGVTHTYQKKITCAVIEILAGGGGGGGSSHGGAGGGAAGGYAEVRVTAGLTTCTCTVGGGGAGGVGNDNGAVGGDSVVVHGGVTYTAKGGGGGAGSGGYSGVCVPGGEGVAGSGGEISSPGAPGGAGITLPTGGAGYYSVGGMGGSSRYGGGGAVNVVPDITSESDGASATGYGAGGAGAVAVNAAKNGGAGSGGLIIITEYF